MAIILTVLGELCSGQSVSVPKASIMHNLNCNFKIMQLWLYLIAR